MSIGVKLLMDEALRVIWSEGTSHAEPQRPMWSGGVRIEDIEDARTFLSDLGHLGEASDGCSAAGDMA